MVYWYEGILLCITSWIFQSYAVDPSKEACLHFEPNMVPACDCVVFQSYGLSEGQFYSPNYPTPYKRGLNCILYSFIGDFNEIVQIKFVTMDIRPTERPGGRCKDWLRIYQNLDRPVVNEHNKHDEELCGNMSNIEEKVFYSRDRALILEFHSDPSSSGTNIGFKGQYSFLEKGSFLTPGLEPNTQCSHFIHHNGNTTKGRFFSPRFPMHYPKSANCKYVFSGKERERVEITFTHIRLPKHKQSCDLAGDKILVYDGKNSSAKLIENFCNTANSRTVVSSTPFLYIEFKSDRNKEKQGFEGKFFFTDDSTLPTQPHDQSENDRNGNSKSYNEIRESYPVESACDKRIESRDNQKEGTCTSDNYPHSYPASQSCEYLFVAAGKERVQLNFTEMDLHFTGADARYPYSCDTQDHVTIFVQLERDWQSLGKYCGQKRPSPLMSTGRRMKVVFKSYSSPKSHDVKGFSLRYFFRTDYGVSGTGEQDARLDRCEFTYNSSRLKSGFFTSPNFPGNYPGNCSCRYIFNGQKKEKINISFEVFDLSAGESDRNGKTGNNTQPPHPDLEIGEVLVPRFPISDKRITVCTFIFRSRVRTQGFFTSPNYGGIYPRNTVCRYQFFARRNERVQIHFTEFEVDGIIPRCDSQTDSDSVTFSNFLTEDTMMPIYCRNAPSDVITSDGAFFMVIFKSNYKYDAKGFKGRYTFIKTEEDMTSTTSSQVNSASISPCILTVFLTSFVILCKTVIIIYL